MNYQTYPMRRAAIVAIETMRGWDAKIERMYHPAHPQADQNGMIWVIKARRGKGENWQYMRDNGYVS